MTVIGAVAALFLKKASGFRNLKELFLNMSLYIGGMLYFLSALLNIYILRFLDYSSVLPLTSITYIWTMILSYYVLDEKVTRKKVIGLSFVSVGAFLIAVI
jgi:drug/metabolite transporter (DMT)-like permease